MYANPAFSYQIAEMPLGWDWKIDVECRYDLIGT
jgi:hypothetical protein